MPRCRAFTSCDTCFDASSPRALHSIFRHRGETREQGGACGRQPRCFNVVFQRCRRCAELHFASTTTLTNLQAAADSDSGDIVVLVDDGSRCRPVRSPDNSPSTPIIPRRASQSTDCMPSFGETTHRVRCSTVSNWPPAEWRSAVMLLLRRQLLPFGSIARWSVRSSFLPFDRLDRYDRLAEDKCVSLG